MSNQSVAAEPAIKRAQIGKVTLQFARDRLRPVHQFRQRRIELPLHLFRQKTPPALGQQCRFHVARNPAFERRFKIRAGAVNHDCVLASLYPHRMRHPRWNDDRDIVRAAMIVAINKKCMMRLRKPSRTSRKIISTRPCTKNITSHCSAS